MRELDPEQETTYTVSSAADQAIGNVSRDALPWLRSREATNVNEDTMQRKGVASVRACMRIAPAVSAHPRQ